jgi:3-methyladenine DNA glycosylase AlkC
MPELLKNYYNEDLVSRIADAIQKEVPSFETSRFLEFVFDDQWERRELKQRMRHITISLHRFLPSAYLETLAILIKVAPKFRGFIAMVFPDFVEVYGLNHLDESLIALEIFTQYSSSEFAIRPFILKNKEQTMKQMVRWSLHESEHVRRLASEGCRPRLPWAVALPDFKKDPSLILPILENLKTDPSEYVRRSVANNLNDIGKDHPDVLLRIVREWKGLNPQTDWIVRHASRSLLKKGNQEALSNFDFKAVEDVEIRNLVIDKGCLRIGDDCYFSFEMAVGVNKDQNLRLEYGVYYVKANGKASRKIFQITERLFSAGKVYPFRKKISFKDLTTRKHYPGRHSLALVVNGVEMSEVQFELIL